METVSGNVGHIASDASWIIKFGWYLISCMRRCVLVYVAMLGHWGLVSSQPHMDRVLVTHLWADVRSLYHYLLEHRSLCLSVVGGLLCYHLFDVASFIDRSHCQLNRPPTFNGIVFPFRRGGLRGVLYFPLVFLVLYHPIWIFLWIDE